MMSKLCLIFPSWSYWLKRLLSHLSYVYLSLTEASSVRLLLPDFRGSGATYWNVQNPSLLDVSLWRGREFLQIRSPHVLRTRRDPPLYDKKGTNKIKLFLKPRFSNFISTTPAYKYGCFSLYFTPLHPPNISLLWIMHQKHKNTSEESPCLEGSQGKNDKTMDNGKGDKLGNDSLPPKSNIQDQVNQEYYDERNNTKEETGKDASIMHIINEIDQVMEVDINEGNGGTCSQDKESFPGNLSNEEAEVFNLPLVDITEDGEEDQFDCEYDDLLVEELNDNANLSLIPPMTKALMEPIIDSKLPAFTEQDLDDFLNDKPNLGFGIPATSESSYHSLRNSMKSSSSFVLKMGNLGVHLHQPSSSTSGKRKTTDGMDDTASSSSMSAKKAKK